MWKALLLVGIQLFANKEQLMQQKVERAYGSWVSPITAEEIASHSIRLGSAREQDGAIYLFETRPAEGGRALIVRMTPEGDFEDLIPKEYNIRTRVHEYGGGSSLIVDETIYFSNFTDQQLYKRDGDGLITQLTHEKECRFADGCAWGDLLFYVMEVHGETVENCLVAIDRTSGAVKRIAEGCDFYAGPCVSPDGNQLAYYCWNNPNMPWDGGELRVALLNEDGTLGESRVVAGGPSESIAQHAWGPDGLLYYSSDISGWWNLYRDREEGREALASPSDFSGWWNLYRDPNGWRDALCPMEAEFGFPQWTFGSSFFDFWGDKIVCTYSQLGSDFLVILDEGRLIPIDVPFSSIAYLSVAGDHLYFTGSSPEIPTSCIQYNLKTKNWTILKQSSRASFPTDFISHPQAIEFPTEGGATAHAFYYPPKNPYFVGLKGELPPLLVLSHGGPTAHVSPDFDLRIQYWTSRGIAVVDVNYGGSSGYGREYRNRLIGNWGVVDVDDCTHAALYCAGQALADRNRLAIAGGSAGGFTTLACLTFRDVFRAGASFYGVSDLEALTLDTHKFEARYLDSLIGPYPEKQELYLERSPLHHVDRIKCPIILLQGDEDKIVPPDQSEKMYLNLLARGIPTAYLLFEKEQHGFRRSQNIQRALEAESYFFSKIFGYELADSIAPIKIENFGE
jgi:dipeptidyl aminopeptidase/acylaminoacyl peptidase